MEDPHSTGVFVQSDQRIASHMDPIDLTVDLPFHPSAWIGVGRRYSNLLPQEVLDAERDALKIPGTFRNRLPPPEARIHDFISFTLPFQSGALVFHAPAQWFSHDTPNTDPNILLTRSVPPANVLEDLEKIFGQTWLDGGHSIVDPRFNNQNERFPLWALSFWKELQKTIECQDEWKKSVRWLNSMTHPMEIIEQVRGLVRRLAWNTPLCLAGATSLDLAGFLGTSWLSDTQMNMMVDVLRKRMEVEECARGIIIEPMEFSWEIVLVAKDKKEPMSPYLSRLADQIKRGSVRALWFPIHINDSHWVTGKIDLERRTFAFGMSFVLSATDVIETYLR